jgi:hypothetical protein
MAAKGAALTRMREPPCKDTIPACSAPRDAKTPLAVGQAERERGDHPGRWRCPAGPAKLTAMRTVPSLLWWRRL